MMVKMLLIGLVTTLCLQVQDIRGQATQLRPKRNDVPLFRFTLLEKWAATMQTEVTEIKIRLNVLDRFSTQIAEITSRLDEIQKVSNTVVPRPTYDEELVKIYISEVMSKTLDTIQDGLVEEKQQRIRLEYLALETKDSINNQNELFKKTGLLENRIEENKDLINNQNELCQKKTGLLEYRTEENKDLIKNQNELFEKKTGLLEKRMETFLVIAKDCWDLQAVHDVSQDGVYMVLTPDGRIRSLRCDMTTDGGGWTVIQRRGDGSVGFEKTYEEYKSVFGNLTGEFWMGNDFLNVFTRDVDQTIRVDICDWDDETKWAKYRHFSVGPSSDNYRLAVDDYSGTAGDALLKGYKGQSYSLHNGIPFSAPGVDNDNYEKDCATLYHSGWWFNKCFSANLNGVYYSESSSRSKWQGIQWRTWTEDHSFKGTEMKIRPFTATPSTSKPFKCPVI